jgi:hypothetical protein
MYLSATKHTSILLGEVDKHLQLTQQDRFDQFLHPSEMSRSDWCHRADWFRLRGAVPLKKTQVTGLIASRIFEEGHTIHTKWQKWLSEMGIIWGIWQCVICKERRYAWADALTAGVCPSLSDGGPHIWAYQEVPLQDHLGLSMRGHADGIINPSRNEPLLLEIKSIGPGTLRALDVMGHDDHDDDAWQHFTKVSRPLKSHVVQTMIYLRLAEEHNTAVGAIKRGLVLYESKADQKNKEFIVTRDDKWTDPLFEAAADIAWAITRGREIKCNHGGCARCAVYEET